MEAKIADGEVSMIAQPRDQVASFESTVLYMFVTLLTKTARTPQVARAARPPEIAGIAKVTQVQFIDELVKVQNMMVRTSSQRRA